MTLFIDFYDLKIKVTLRFTLQHQKNTVRKQNIQISHESIIREYSNIENAI